MYQRLVLGLCTSFLLPTMSLFAIFAGEWTEYGGWAPGYFVDEHGCCRCDPAQSYYDFYYPRCCQTQFEKICEPPPKVHRGEFIYRDGHWNTTVVYPTPEL